MKAIAKTRPDVGLEIIEVPEPTVRPGTVKIRVERASLCGTDLHIYEWDEWSSNRIKPTRIVGHEFCGTVIEVGEGVTDRKIGDFVASESHVVDPNSPDYLAGLGHIDRTTQLLGVDIDGGFAPYAVIPAMNARPVPTSVPKDVASMLDALGNAVHTVMDGPVEGKDILITGLGPIGLFSVAICKCLGARNVFATEISPYRTQLGIDCGADLIFNPMKDDVASAFKEHVPEGFDAVLEMSGHPSSLELAVEYARPGGRISLLGLYAQNKQSIELNKAIFKGLSIHGIIGRRLWETWDQMIWLLDEKGLDVSAVVTHQMPFTEFESAIQAMKKGEAGKVVLTFD
ncbi:MAG: L-threonine 3-dehydrogenase [Fimbriimonadaceae bacterium]|nr:MAG: L-threonine 3-dehydrogenase [Fimbriimonadaceae bacterium]